MSARWYATYWFSKLTESFSRKVFNEHQFCPYDILFLKLTCLLHLRKWHDHPPSYSGSNSKKLPWFPFSLAPMSNPPEEPSALLQNPPHTADSPPPSLCQPLRSPPAAPNATSAPTTPHSTIQRPGLIMWNTRQICSSPALPKPHERSHWKKKSISLP